MTTTATSPAPAVGTLATVGVGSDAYPAVVTGVSATGKTITIEKVAHEIKVTKEIGAWYSANEGEIALSAPTGNNPEKYTLRKTGKYVRSGTPARYGGLSIGDAVFHYDPSF